MIDTALRFQKRVMAPAGVPPAGLLLLCLGLGGCGAGTAVIASSGSSGGSNAPPAVSAFLVADPRTSPPCAIHFVLSDAEGDQATIEFLYQVPGEAATPIEHLSLPGNPATFATTSQGVAYSIPWNFPAEDLLPDDARLTPGVLVMAKAQGAPDVIVLGANAVQVGLGNDAPAVTVEDPPPDTSGVVPLPLHLSDSSGDVIDVRVEFDIEGDDPDLGWQLAMPAGLPAGTPPPKLALTGILAPPAPGGADIVFFWDTNVDLRDLEHEVRLRATPFDPVAEGVPAVTGVFSVDNNAAPILQLSEGALISDPDTARGIHVPFVAIDEEGDEITVVLQWRREDEDFPPLPGTAAEIEAVLADREQRQAYHICSQYPRTFEGRAVPIDANHLRLPELSGGLSFLVTEGLVGRQLEILRPPTGLVAASDAWSLNPLVDPVAALPLDGGTHALVLDGSPGGRWSLSRVRLTDGELDGPLASGTGVPSAMCLARDEAALVASSDGSEWRLTRVELASGVTRLLASSGTAEPVRGIASLGTDAAVLTVGDSVVRVDWSTPGIPRMRALRTGLATPWGIVLDPRNAGWALVAESDAPAAPGPGRVVAIELETGILRPVAIQPSAQDGFAFPRPRSIALQRKGTRLVAVCETDPLAGEVELRGVDLDRAETSSAMRVGEPLATGTTALAAGAEDDLLIATSGPGRLVLVAGGVEKRAVITAVDPDTAVVTLAGSDFSPAPGRAPRWRMELFDDGPLRVTSSAQGVAHSFLWNSLDLPGGGSAFLRGTPLDTDIGTVASSTGAKAVSPQFGADPQEITTGDNPRAFALGDLDGDGDLDLVCTKTFSDELRLLWQTSPGVFEPDPAPLGGPSVTGNPASVLAVDLDGDGDLDLASGNQLQNTVTIFWQETVGVFGPVPTTLVVPGPPGPSQFIRLEIQAADLEGDGDGYLDLVCANYGSDNLAVFRQSASRMFQPPIVLGGPATTPGVTFVEVADLDADGDLDLVSANSLNGTLTIFRQNASNDFDPSEVLDVTPSREGPFSVEAADLDGDGDLDLVSANGLAHDLSVFWQTMPGTFEKDPTPLGGLLVTAGATHVLAADLDGDGDLDIYCANVSLETISVFWQTAPRSFDPVPTTVGGRGTSSGIKIDAADLDGDGDLDLVSANPGPPDSITVFWQTAPGVFDPEMDRLQSFELGRPLDMQPADLDGDGHLDLVTANALRPQTGFGNNLTVYWQADQGVLEPVPTTLGGPASTGGPSSVRAADLDGDGDLDVVSANSDGNDLTVFWQAEPRSFEPTPTAVGGGARTRRPTCVQASDLNGDGHLDLVSANQVGNDLTIFWRAKAGPRDFQPGPTLAPVDGSLFVQAADLNRDGELDLVSASHDRDELAVFWQTEAGEFDPTPILVGGPTVMSGPACVRAVDLDGDGDLDLVSANEIGNDLTVFWQRGGGVFDPVPVRLGDRFTTLDARSVQAADLDADGDLDLVTLNRHSDRSLPDPSTLTLFWQTRPGQFAPTPTLIEVPGPTTPNGIRPEPAAVQVVDLDADGDPDLVFASTGLSYLGLCRKLD